MTAFCANNMTNNVQHVVTSHYVACVSGGVTAKSHKGMVIGIGFTTGVPRILQ